MPYMCPLRSSSSQMFFKLVVLKNFTIFKHTTKTSIQPVFHVQTTCKDRFHVVSTWNTRGVFAFSCEYCGIFKKSFFYKTPLVAASGLFQYIDSYVLLLFHIHFKENFPIFLTQIFVRAAV